jgi:uncharacterized damage-inducible protein DinB
VPLTAGACADSFLHHEHEKPMARNLHPEQILRDRLIECWNTSNRVTEFFFENLPDELWGMTLTGNPRRTIRMLAGHTHNARCMWIKMIGRRYRISPPPGVDRRRVTRTELVRALRRSSEGMVRLLNAGLDTGGVLEIKVPWSNIPSDVVHFMSYIIAHEAHHRGQIILVARILNYRLPPSLTNGVWQWKRFAKQTRGKRK